MWPWLYCTGEYYPSCFNAGEKTEMIHFMEVTEGACPDDSPDMLFVTPQLRNTQPSVGAYFPAWWEQRTKEKRLLLQCPHTQTSILTQNSPKHLCSLLQAVLYTPQIHIGCSRPNTQYFWMWLYLKTSLCQNKSDILGGMVLRWQRNRRGRPLSPPQIHQKNI